MKTRFQVFSGDIETVHFISQDVNKVIDEQESNGFRVSEKSVYFDHSPVQGKKPPRITIVVCLWFEADEMETDNEQ